ncbi:MULTISPECIES: MaoC family dehydratase [Amycolatopsis]|uniref:MaoC like domain-containing protein n=2 Tax=Amycolatopsis TaxID=1813 RepID=A0A1I3KD56_9PSEU|nr:MaoC/PaaZ C-terminal domain-containing protein [Amycolatopsis sacchari]SFI70208.1 MaoC like domain-containing protein [Amycolatopsis sacchari]
MTTVLRMTFGQDDVDRFGRFSGGDGRIHTDPGYARSTPFGRTLVQGMLLVALVERAVELVESPARADSRLDVTFVAPVGVGDEVAITHTRKGTSARFEATTSAGTVLVAVLHPTEETQWP